MNERISKTLNDRFSLEGRRGIVTGGSAGLGREIAYTLAQAGAHVMVFSRTGAFKRPLRHKLPGIRHISLDITDTAAAKPAVDTVGQEGLDFLVNNAGETLRKPVENVSKQEWKRILDTNLNAVFQLCRFAFPYLKSTVNGGRIVNITSMAAHKAFNEVVPYVTAKTGLLGLTRGLSVEWAQYNILVNAVSPGWFKTDMLKGVVDPERERKILDQMPLHRYGELREVADTVLFLLSPAASYITGQAIAVDGGALSFGY